MQKKGKPNLFWFEQMTRFHQKDYPNKHNIHSVFHLVCFYKKKKYRSSFVKPNYHRNMLMCRAKWRYDLVSSTIDDFLRQRWHHHPPQLSFDPYNVVLKFSSIILTKTATKFLQLVVNIDTWNSTYADLCIQTNA